MSIPRFLREEWLVLVAMLGVCVLVVVGMALLFSFVGLGLSAVLASPLTVLVVVLIMAIECAVLWWASRP